MKRHCNLEEKLAILKLVEQGQSVRSVSDKLNLNRNNVYEWVAAYKEHGIQGLITLEKRKKRLSYEEKCKFIREYQESELTLYQLSGKYGVSSTALSDWAQLVEKGGFEALAPKKREPKTGMVRMKRLPKEECEKENERLRKENERLRLENLLLKKVKALVEEREARNKAIGRKPSKN